MRNVRNCILISIGLLIVYSVIILYSPAGDIIKDKRSEIEYLKEIRKNPKNRNAYASLSFLYCQKEEYEKALKIQKNLIENTKANANDYVVLTDLYKKIGKDKKFYKDSIMKYLREAQKLPDISVLGLILIGNGFKEIGEDSLTINIFNRALNRFPKDSASYYNHLKKEIVEGIEAIKREEK